ncbi:hypothetical protein GGF46_000153 [Coemansia sp. RSA 552]|nr:hypothetical protein GGF46_000153 [Coemansia sp. RSA 552]
MASSGNDAQYTLPPKELDWWSEDAMVRFGTNTQKSSEPAWQDVGANVLRMDSLYDASFHDWLKCEDNVSIIASYLQRIANEYPMDRIINALRWLVSSWRVESTAVIVRHVTAEWAVFASTAAAAKPAAAPFRMDSLHSSTQQPADPAVLSGETRRGLLVRELTKDWTCQQIAQLVGMLSLSFWSERTHLEAFLRTLVSDWDFCRLSSFFSYVSSQLGLDYRVKVSMLQQAARRNASRLSLKRARNGTSRTAAPTAGDAAAAAAEPEDLSNKRMRQEPAEPSSVAPRESDNSAGDDGAPVPNGSRARELRSDAIMLRSDSTPLSASATGSASNSGGAQQAPSSSISARPHTQSSTIDTSDSSAFPGESPRNGRAPAPLRNARTPLCPALEGSSTMPSSPTEPQRPCPSSSASSASSSRNMSAATDDVNSAELQMTPLTTSITPGRHQDRFDPPARRPRRMRTSTSRSPTMPSTSSPLVAASFAAPADPQPSSELVARRPLTPQASPSTYTADAHPSSPTLRRHRRHNHSYQTHDCAQTATESVAQPSRPAMRLHAASISSGANSSNMAVDNADDAASQVCADQDAEQQQPQDFCARTSSESELGQFDGPPSSHLALPLPSADASPNAPSLCGRASAAPYDVLGIAIAADSGDHHVAGSSA